MEQACSGNMKLGSTKFSIYISQFIIIEMQIIHRYAGFYPFGLQKEPQNTYVELMKQNLAEEDITHYRLKFKFFREMVLNHVIKLTKLSRENNNLRFLYEYQPLSLQKYLSQLSENSNKRIETSLYKCLLQNFTTNMEEITKELIHYQIKTDLLMTNLAVSQNHKNLFSLKLFLQPQCECFALKIFSQGKQEDLKDLIHQNKQSLVEFYSNEKKKMIVQFEELMEIYFGKMEAESYRPNFIINGAKLVFINQEGSNKQTKNQMRQRKKSTSSDKINFSMKYYQKDRRSSGQGNLAGVIASLQRRKLNQVKTATNNKSCQNGSKSISQHQNVKNGQYNIHFEPAEITKDRTMIVQEQEYLQSLEDQIKNMHEQQRLNSKQLTRTSGTLNTNNIAPICDQKLQCFKVFSITDEPKSQKKHKYKMKIITSHDVQIQEEKGPQVVDINYKNFNSDSFRKFNINNNQLCLQNSSGKAQDEQQNQQYKEQVPQKTFFLNRYSDGDAFLLKNQISSKPIATSLIKPEQAQNSNKYCNCKTEQHNLQIESKYPQTENYLVKIQSVKEKAQKLLRQYAHNKVKKV